MAEGDVVSLGDAAEDVPPKRGPGRPRKDAADKAPRKPRGARKAASVATLRKQLLANVTNAGVLISAFPPLREDGFVIVEGAEDLVDAWVNLAETNPKVMRSLQLMCAGSAWSAAMMATASIGIPIAANHGLIPEFLAHMVTAQRDPSAVLAAVKANGGSEPHGATAAALGYEPEREPDAMPAPAL